MTAALNYLNARRTKLLVELAQINRALESLSPEARIERGTQIRPKPPADTKLIDFGWSVRTGMVFYRERIVTVADLLALSEADLLRLPNFGRKSLNEVNAWMIEHGLERTTP